MIRKAVLEVAYEEAPTTFHVKLEGEKREKKEGEGVSREKQKVVHQTVALLSREAGRLRIAKLTEEILRAKLLSDSLKERVTEWTLIEVPEEEWALESAIALLMNGILQAEFCKVEEAVVKEALERWYGECLDVLQSLLGKRIDVESFLDWVDEGIEEGALEEEASDILEGLQKRLASLETVGGRAILAMDQTLTHFDARARENAERLGKIAQDTIQTGRAIEELEAWQKTLARQSVEVAERVCKKV